MLQHTGRAHTHEYGVSEVIGAVMLIAVVSAAVAVIAVAMLSQPAPEKIPALEAVISNTGNAIQIYHNGGDTLQKADFKVLVNGAEVPESVLWPGSDTTWSSGETLTFVSPNAKTVQIVYTKGSTAAAVLSTADFGVVGNSSTSLIITAAAGTGGTISPSGAVSVVYGDSQTFTIAPDTGYRIVNVKVDGVSVGTVTSYTFSTVTSSHSIYATFAKNPVITASAGVHGSISPIGAVSVDYTGSQTFTLVPDTGYHVEDVLVDTVSQGAITSYNFTNVLADHTISATFAINAYSITPSAGANGLINPDTVQMVNYGDSMVFTITPVNSSYRVADILIDGVSNGPNTSYTFSNVSANHTIAASFALNTYTITAPDRAEWVYVPGWQATYYSDMTWTTVAGTRIDNEIQYANALANTSFSLHAPTNELNWPLPMVGRDTMFSVTWDGYLLVTDSALYTFSLTSDDTSKLWIDDGLVIDHSGTDPYAPVTGTSTLTPGYHHIVVKMDQLYSNAVARLQYSSSTMPLQQVTVWHTSGVITPAGTTTVNYGATPTYTITPGTGYHVADVLVNGTSVGAVTSYIFPPVTTNQTISATFAINTYTITASTGANGAVTPAGTTTVNYGDTPTYTITPGTGYHVADVLVNGTSVGAVTSYTFPGVASDKTISATFAINQYTINATAGSNGSISPGNTTVNYGGYQLFTITPSTGYHVSNVLVDNVSNGTITSYNFTNVAANHTIAATFAINTYNINATAGSNGSISPGNTTVNYGGYQLFTITPSTGYHVSNVLVDNVSNGTITSYNFTNVAANHTIAATFAINTYNINATAGSNGSISPGNTTVNYGGYQLFTITPSTGYHVSNVLVDNVSNGTITSYNFTNVAANHTIAATFMMNPPVANFTATPLTGGVPLNVQFTDTSTNNPTSWIWNFGDTMNTTVSNAQHPTHTYEYPGNYSVQLWAANSGGTTNTTKEGYIFTYYAAVANFTGTPTSGSVGLSGMTVQFTDRTPVIIGLSSWDWDFGDGYYSEYNTHQNPGHTYTSVGLYTVNLSVTNAFSSDYLRRLNYINVTPNAPAAFAYNATSNIGAAPLTVEFWDMSSYAPTSWLWHFGDGTPDVTTQDVTHTFTTPGTYNVSLTASNAWGSSTGYNLVKVYVTPTVTSVSPATGTTAGGKTVTIIGTNLVGASAASFGGTAATGVSVINATAVSATTPVHAAGVVNVLVTTPNGTATGTNVYTYITPPAVTSVVPSTGTTAGGTTVTITGTNLVGASAASFGGTAATGVSVINATAVSATTPVHAAGVVNVLVTTPNGTATGTNVYTYVLPSPPTITGISPTPGRLAGGIPVTITGTNLAGATVTFGSNLATVTSPGTNSIIVTSPAGSAAGAVTVTVTTAGGSATTTYRYYVIESRTSAWTVPAGVTTVEYIVVAGGGGGGYNGGAGGGAGGYLHGTMTVATGNNLAVVVGSGGNGGTSGVGGDGGNSVFAGTITAIGGGGGAGPGSSAVSGRLGGSGGGSTRSAAVGSGTAGQGNAGGIGLRSSTNAYSGGGGGGASQTGYGSTSSTIAGAGGAGSSSESALLIEANVGEDVGGTRYLAGGGGGGARSGTGGSGGNGGGGDGVVGYTIGNDGSANTGGGGGGGGRTSNGGAGGSGIVIIKYY